MYQKKQPRTPTSPRDSALRNKQIALPIRRPPAEKSSAAPPAAEAVTANPAAAVPVEAGNSERSGYENNTQTSVRTIDGAGSAIVTLCLRAENANGARRTKNEYCQQKTPEKQQEEAVLQSDGNNFAFLP